MRKVFEILALLLAPMAWGLLVDFVFERVRRRRRSARGPGSGEAAK